MEQTSRSRKGAARSSRGSSLADTTGAAVPRSRPPSASPSSREGSHTGVCALSDRPLLGSDSDDVWFRFSSASQSLEGSYPSYDSVPIRSMSDGSTSTQGGSESAGDGSHYESHEPQTITFRNGTTKTVRPDGVTLVNFFNGDRKETHPDGQVVYFYAEAQTTHTTLPDGMEVIEFPNGQVEKHHSSGKQEIIFPDKTVKCIYVNGEEETFFPDGTSQRVSLNGEKFIEFPNGQQEVHTAHYRKRLYPDGTVKVSVRSGSLFGSAPEHLWIRAFSHLCTLSLQTVFADGRQETSYKNGRVRVKDRDGQVVLDH